MQNENQSKRNRLPQPRWLALAGLGLVLWAAALLLWWSDLRTSDAEPAGQSTTLHTPVAQRATAAPGATPVPQSTLALAPITRTAGALVEQADWVALADRFDADRALEDIRELASPRFAGRATGSAGAQRAAEWIAQRFAEYGLLPAGDGGTYYQEFPVPYAELTAMPEFALLGTGGSPAQEFELRADYTLWPGGYADGGEAEGPVLWLGDGNSEDYRRVDSVGAIVLCRWQAPLSEVQRQALEHGAVAILLYRPDYDMQMRRTAREDAILPRGIPTLVVGDAVVKALLQGSGLSIDDLPLDHTPRPMLSRVRLSVPLSYQTDAVGRNVLGVLPGSAPDGIAQTLIVGAHYDHLGVDPDGTLWGGANDDASGVAALLELARLWREHGYIPRRTVLFAAWDAEEIGLNGSRYYVSFPRLPLASTVGMLQLDMVGAGRNTLLIEPHGLVADQSFASAAFLGIPTHEVSGGGSDHVPFASVEVPATLFIWDYQSAPAIPYHVPGDDIGLINRVQLSDAGRLAGLVLTSLASDAEELESLELDLQSALEKRDEPAFLALLSPAATQAQAAASTWFARLRAGYGANMSLTSDAPLVARDVATSTVTISYRWKSADSSSTAQFPALWHKLAGEWTFAGPAVQDLAGEHVVLQQLPRSANADELARQADTLHARLNAELGAVLPDPLLIRSYGSGALLGAFEQPPPGSNGEPSWYEGDRIVLGRTSSLTSTLLGLALQGAGWSASQASWLSSGLTEQWSGGTGQLRAPGRVYIPTLLQADQDKELWPSAAMPAASAVASDQRAIWDAQTWAMTQYVTANGGPRFSENLDPSGWESALLQPWRDAQRGISATLTQRSTSVLALDEQAFLATVDGSDSALLQEERHWFADLARHPVAEFALQGQLLALEDGKASVRLTMRSRLADEGSQLSTVTWEARFVHREGRWVYADFESSTVSSEHFVLKHDPYLSFDLADALLAGAESAYSSVVADLGFEPPTPVEIKLYSDPALFRSSIYLSMSEARGWNEPGESIKLTNISAVEPSRIVAHELTHLLLFQLGVQHAGVHEGTAQFEAALHSPTWKNEQLRKWRQQVYNTVRSGRPVSLQSLSDWADWKTESSLVYNLSWDCIDYLRSKLGREPFLEWLKNQGNGLDWSEAFARATGLSFESFDADWRESVLRGHIAPEHIAAALSFDGDAASDHVARLAEPGWYGRESGSAGNSLAADYVASAMANYGLVPAGDDGTYLQAFSTTATRLSAAPQLSYAGSGPSAAFQVTLAYLVDFREVIGGAAGAGQVRANLVYAPSIPEGVALHGRALLTVSGGDLREDARLAQASGASALLLMTEAMTTQMTLRSAAAAPPADVAIPVLELTREAAEAMLKAAQYWPLPSGRQPAAVALPLSVTLSVPLSVTPDVAVANVLGVLTGSDPAVADQFIVIGAQLDGIGSPVLGPFYPAANHGASGVAVILEIARSWQAAGYKPRRSVLFAAWNASEAGRLGSRYFARNAPFGLAQITALIELDRVGQGRGFYLDVGGNEPEDALILAFLDNAARQLEGRINFLKYEPLGDDATFHAMGVPTITATWERAEYTNTPDDTPDRIDPTKLQATGRIVALTVMTLAEQ